ncbi:MAG: guanylate kinase [Lachnospiraceae bacterium]|nr:guanylate kinase [Lachnospiraceae bacterium]
MGHIFYLMGKSSSGKDTIYKEIQKRIVTLHQIVLYTTRPIRVGEEDGKEYFFVKEEQQKKLAEEGKIIELRAYNTIHGVWKYFTVNDKQIDLETKDYLVIGTLESYEQMRIYFGSEAMVPIYVETEDGIRLNRALERERMEEEPKYEELCRRFLADAKDFSEKKLERLGITRRFLNTELESCVEEITVYIREHL